MIVRDLSGMRFGRLLVIRQQGVLSNGKSSNLKAWLCSCLCGKEVVLRGRDLTSGNTISCGCFAAESTTNRSKSHGLSKTHLYKIWGGVKKRCLNPKCTRHKFYKNVSICKEWLEFEPFYSWAVEKYAKGLQLDRINTLLGYSPDNCRFVSQKANAQNKRNCKTWHINGLVFQSAGDASKHFGCAPSHIQTMCEGRQTKTKYYPKHPNCYSVKKYAEAI